MNTKNINHGVDVHIHGRDYYHQQVDKLKEMNLAIQFWAFEKEIILHIRGER